MDVRRPSSRTARMFSPGLTDPGAHETPQTIGTTLPPRSLIMSHRNDRGRRRRPRVAAKDARSRPGTPNATQVPRRRAPLRRAGRRGRPVRSATGPPGRGQTQRHRRVHVRTRHVTDRSHHRQQGHTERRRCRQRVVAPSPSFAPATVAARYPSDRSPLFPVRIPLRAERAATPVAVRPTPDRRNVPPPRETVRGVSGR